MTILAGLKPTSPGELLRDDIFPYMGLSREDAAFRLCLSPGDLDLVLDGTAAIWPSLAERIGRLTGTTAESWMDMQRAYTTRMAKGN